MNNAPIGVFDSGLGGLTAVKELCRLLPHENIIYFGDTGRVPYGNRSRETIRKYARQDMQFLLSNGVKLIITACGTVSSVSADIGAALPVPYTGVVLPAVKAAVNTTKTGRIGIIGTTATIGSGSYSRHISEMMPDASIFSVDCPLFVPLVENGFLSDDVITRLTVERYLAPLKERDVDTLILGCTHYPILAPAISEFMGERVKLIDVGAATAAWAAEMLAAQELLNDSEEPGEHKFFVSDRIEGFSKVAGIFLGEDISGDVMQFDIHSVQVE